MSRYTPTQFPSSLPLQASSERWRSGVSNERRWIVEATFAIIGVQDLGQVLTLVGAFAML